MTQHLRHLKRLGGSLRESCSRCDARSAPERAQRAQKYWQPATGRCGDIKRRSPFAGWLIAVAGLCSVGSTATTSAHHSFAMYDQTVTKTMTGKLVRLIPGSSHSQIVFDVLDAEGKPTLGQDGKAVKWQVELGSAANIARQGVTVKTFTPGTILTVSLYPQRNGANQGAIAGPLVLCGMTMPTGGCTPQTGTVMKPPAN